MTERASQSGLLLAIAALAGLVQISAGVVLGRDSGELVDQAAMGGALGPVLVIAGVVASWLGAWLFGARWIVAAVIGVGGTAAAIGIGRPFTHGLGFLYYGEFILHHFLAILCAGICVRVAHRWSIDPELGRARAAPLCLAALGVVLLLGQHVQDALDLGVPLEPLGQAGAALLLLAVPVGLALHWRALVLREQILVIGVLAPLGTRLILGGVGTGALLGVGAAAPITGACAVAALLIFLLLQPRLGPSQRQQALALRGASILIGAFASNQLYRLYLGKFIKYEDRLGGLLRSIVGFDLPYPSYVAGWRLGVASVAIFALVSGLVSGLSSARTRPAALAIGLMVVAGLGLTSPQLLLMHAAGALALIAALADEDAGAVVVAVPARPSQEIEELLLMVADRLDAAAPVLANEGDETVIALRSDVRHVAIDLRARSSAGAPWVVTLRVGVLGRGAPEAEVIADPGGDGPRLRGDVHLAGEGGGVLSALSAFPSASARLWSAGAEIDLGEALDRLSPASLEALIRALVRQIRGPA